MDNISATLPTRSMLAKPLSIGEVWAGAIGAAIATIPVLLAVIAMGSFGGGGIGAHTPLSARTTQVVLSIAPLLLVAVTVAAPFAARSLGVRTRAAAPIRLTATGRSLAAAALMLFSVLAAPMLATAPLLGVVSFYAQPSISFGACAGAVVVGVSVVASLATTQRNTEEVERYRPTSMTGSLFLLPCIILPALFLAVFLLPGPVRSAIGPPMLATPVVSMALFGAAFVTARLRPSADAFSKLNLAGACMFFCAAELSCIANLLELPNLLC